MSQRGRAANGMLLFLIYGMFALFSLLLVVIGAKVYRDLAGVGERNSKVRSAFSYVSNKIRLNREAGGISVQNLNGTPVLALKESFGDGGYQTLIYYYNGALRELLLQDGREFKPNSGEIIVNTDNFDIARQNGGALLTMDEPDGTKSSMSLSFYNGSGA